ncbi:UvrD-helicase domain-containing protein [Pseudonocardia endophytica]|uniref:DNA 3'-5' helicase n=1 Tax=Pseudonocardia endophytica TaxID=401976 RepID=A0A4R1HNK6_PSEEN|nr:UvrD-helicase domain-containing protein [Pseudonocardia endophytica]TCK22781.1 ATP-dependent helicase/nuclease subunit A [Pseudonocardia endophytica]
MTSSAPRTRPVDQTDRDRIRDDLDRSLFVEAGAGSGKTRSLVERIAALVTSGVPMRKIAAITFTEKAAAELRDRLRDELDGRGAVVALDELDGAAIGTLHAFARRILSEHAIEAGLPPLLEVLDHVASQVAVDRRFDELQTELLDDPEMSSTLRLAFAAGLKLPHVRELYRAFDSEWDLVSERVDPTPPPTLPPRIDDLRLRARELAAQRDRCDNHADKLAVRLAELEDWADRADVVDEARILTSLGSAPRAGRIGQAGNWGGAAGIAAVRDELVAWRDDVETRHGEVVDRVLRRLAAWVGSRVLAAADERRAQGRLQFHDLLVLARRLVRDSADARAALQRRFPRLLLDEFQDTDRIQIEVALRIACGAEADASDWRDLTPPPGSVFVVGDPKQSIYRFRRADIATYLDARDVLDDRVDLTTNFRSTHAIIDWVDTTFAALISERAGAQPAFVPLEPRPDAEGGDPVVVLGAAAHAELRADAVRAEEARDIASLITTALCDGDVVRDGDGTRPVRAHDIAILVPTRASILGLEEELDRAGIAYRTEAATFVYSAPEIREVMLCLRAVDDPSDELAVVSTLRSSLFGCADAELWRWRDAGGSWNPFAPTPDGQGDCRVADAMNVLSRWSRGRSRRTPAELLDDVLDARRVLEAAVDGPRYRETWRRLRFVVDQARAWSEAERGSLREYLRWASQQAEDRARVTETVLPERDTSAVRITTVHASKGLEFPFVVLAGLGSGPATVRPTVLWPASGNYELRLGKDRPTAGYEAADAEELDLEACERIRLLYVAATRATSRLVVSLHRRSGRQCAAATLAAACPIVPWTRPDDIAPLPGRRPHVEPLTRWEVWDEARHRALAAGKRPEAESATDIAHERASAELPSLVRHGLAKQPRDLELSAWRKGRYGTAIGRAVHGVLQTIPLDTGEGLNELAEAQAIAEDVPGYIDEIAAAVRSALAAPTVQRAAGRSPLREIYVGTEIDGTLVEGYVDLLFRDDDGLVLVDYKTDQATGAESIAAYVTQLEVYARAIADAVCEQIVRRVLVFLRPRGAIEYEVEES